MSLAIVQQLSKKLRACQRDFDTLDAYYDGEQPLRFLTPEVRRSLGKRLTALVINWPELVLDSIEHRLDVEGFRLGGSDDADDDLWTNWQHNDFDEESQVCHLEAMLYGRTAVSVWSDPDDETAPRYALETPREVFVDYEPGSRKVRSALKQWCDGRDIYATLYLPDRLEKYAGTSSRLNPDNVAGVLKLQETLNNPLGVVPVVPFVNRRRTKRLDGKSELSSVIPIADAVNKLGTDMMVTSEYHAEPRRYATGMQIPQKGGMGDAEYERFKAEVRANWDEATAGKTWIGGNGVNFGQFAVADLSNFVSGIRLLAGIVASISALPPHYVGISAEGNPASADAIRSAEASMVQRAKRKQRGFGGSWEQVNRLGAAIRKGAAVRDLPSEYRAMETVWADPETRTIGTMADAVQKLTAGDNPIITRQTGQEWLGMSPQARRRDERFRRESASTAATAETQAKLDLAARLQSEQGLSQAAAYAAAGLVVAAGQISADQG